MKIAVTGCNGRVGQPVVRCALSLGHEVVGIDLSPHPQPEAKQPEANSATNNLNSYWNDLKFSFIQADLRDYDVALKSLQGCDAMIHLAAYPHPKDYVAITHNRCVHFSLASYYAFAS